MGTLRPARRSLLAKSCQLRKLARISTQKSLLRSKSSQRPLVEAQGRAKKKSAASRVQSTSASSLFAIARVAGTNFQPRRELPPKCPNQAPSRGSQSARDEFQGPHLR